MDQCLIMNESFMVAFYSVNCFISARETLEPLLHSYLEGLPKKSFVDTDCISSNAQKSRFAKLFEAEALCVGLSSIIYKPVMLARSIHVIQPLLRPGSNFPKRH